MVGGSGVSLFRLLRTILLSRRGPQWPEFRQILLQGLSAKLRGVHRWFLVPRKISGNAAPRTPQPPPLFQMAAGYWVSQAIYVAAKLGIADALKSGPLSGEELARITEAHAPSLLRLLRALGAIGVLATRPDGRYELTSLGGPLRSGVPGSLRAMVLTLGEIHYQAWGNLLHSVKTGGVAFDHLYGSRLFEHLSRHSEDGAIFNEAMTDFSALVSYAVVLAYDFSGIRSLVDVGGGHGRLLRTILRMNPGMTGTLFDLAPVIAGADQGLDASGTGERFSVVSGSFFDSAPAGADAYILSGVIHDWDDDAGVKILKNVHRAMVPGGKVLLVEMVVPPGDEVSFSKLLDLNMLVIAGGRERTRAEFQALFHAAGFELKRIVPTAAPLSVIEGIRG